VRDPLKGWTGKDVALADSLSFHDSVVDCTCLGRQFVEVLQPAQHAQIGGVVDDSLDAHGLAVFEILLDPGVLVEDVDGHALIGAVDGGLEDLGIRVGRRGSLPRPPFTADLASEDDFHLLGTAEIEVVGDERLDERPSMTRRGEHDRAGELDLSHGQVSPVAGGPVRGRPGQGQPVKPGLAQRCDGLGGRTGRRSPAMRRDQRRRRTRWTAR
jgi:hypothetical protein